MADWFGLGAGPLGLPFIKCEIFVDFFRGDTIIVLWRCELCEFEFHTLVRKEIFEEEIL